MTIIDPTNNPPSQVSEEAMPGKARRSRHSRLDLLFDILLIAVLLVGAFFRFTGVNWDENQHLHPDERFLTMVETSLEPVKSFAEYFDTSVSTLNPNNRGYGFYVYGTLPLFMVRYVGEWLGETGYDQIHLVGRQMSALMDLGTVFMVYLIAARLYNRRVALLASAFAAMMVLPIQLSHYFTVDTFTNFFGMLAFFFAVCILPRRWSGSAEAVPANQDVTPLGSGNPWTNWLTQEWRSAGLYILFGAALGLALASKINAGLLAILLPAAVLLRYLHLPVAERDRWIRIFFRNLVIAALTSLVVFRIFQPFAFSGPGFFDLKPNPQWIDSLRSLAAQSTGDVDFPPALQWARRPIWFALQHMIFWGMGLPLGLLAWGGFLGMGYRIFIGSGRQHLLIWVWTGIYFAYQSYNWTRSMRYQMLIYPTLAIIAAWAVWALWDRAREGRAAFWRAASLGIGLIVACLTFAYAYSFTQIYVRPMTRVEASRWIYQNNPGPINVHIQTEGETINQPVAYRSGYAIRANEEPMVLSFRPRRSGELINIEFEHLVSPDGDGNPRTFSVAISESPDTNSIATAHLLSEFRAEGDPRGQNYSVSFNDAVMLDPEKTYYLIMSLDSATGNLNLAGPIIAAIYDGQGAYFQPLPEPVEALKQGRRFENAFTAQASGMVEQVTLNRVVDWESRPEAKTLRLSLLDAETGNSVLATADIQSSFLAIEDHRGEAVTFRFTEPVEVQSQHRYTIVLEHVDGPGALAVYGSKQANESSWDDALPVSLDGYNAYDYYYGIFRSDLNFEMYWDDNQEKLNRFLTTLDQADSIFISSNRQWGTTTRIPERYPLTSEYYRRLLGCPAEKEITWCYSVAQPGMFAGDLGFELTAVFQSDPSLGSLRFNTQFAEEAFTVYDHPKVLIFSKTADFRMDRVTEILSAVDLSTVVHVTPRKAKSFPGNLLLPGNRLGEQRSGGTWSELFDTEALINRYSWLTVILWYFAISILGWLIYPFARLALRGLPDRGYPQARLIGLLALALPVWLLGSYQISFQPVTISLVFCVLGLANVWLAILQRKSLFDEFRSHWKYFLMVEGITLAFFLVFLLVRLGNPDLWHPWKGGEKPMDFSYFNAVLKSSSFPPYDPWFAGGYINYYYYGFVLVGVPVKWLGIVPATAYNLILPTLFSMLAMAGFSTGWNLFSAIRPFRKTRQTMPSFDGIGQNSQITHWLAGLGSAVSIAVLGNWGSVRMIWHGLQRLANMQVPFEQASLPQRIAWTIQGFARLVSVPGTRLPYGQGDWYWIPSRAIPGEPITEFPAFTFLYADLHAHMIALPITILALSWALSVLFQRWNWKNWGQLAASFLLGGLAIGALRPTNTWDWPVFLVFGCFSVTYTAVRYGAASRINLFGIENPYWKRLLFSVFGVLGLVSISTVLYHPFSTWYGQAYNEVALWDGSHTPFWSYLTHWGVFLFAILSWMIQETVDWMASTPVSALNHLRRFREIIIGAIIVFLLAVIGLTALGVGTSWLILTLAVWAAVLILKPGQPDAKRAVLFMTGTALVLTLFVEVAVLKGDIGRMNTVFKFYLQAWSLLSLSAGAGLFWLVSAAGQNSTWVLPKAWSSMMILLVCGAAMFPLLAGSDKISDRMTDTAPHTLDGMAYMSVSFYTEGEHRMDLSEDYRAIRWSQENIAGSPVIVEANVPEYRWGNRYTIYTGLPSVVGWNWHQRQQRAITPGDWVFKRIEEISAFYNTNRVDEALKFLQRYQVEYIYVGQLERAVYSPAGLQKFEDQNEKAWQEIYRDGQTIIYKVIQ